MRLDRFEITAFGRLAGVSADTLAGHPLLVVTGPNEAGKTTFAHFLETMLHGFSPVEHGNHPAAPWSDRIAPAGSRADAAAGSPCETGALAGEAAFVLADGRRLHVARRLHGAPEGRMVLGGKQPGGETRELGNRPVPCLGPVDRALWRRFHRLTREELAGLDETGWQIVAERLLGGTHEPGLRSARAALQELERLAAAEWRSAPRGHTAARRLKLELRRLRRERDLAAARHARLLALRDELAARQWQRDGLQEQLRETEARLHRAETLLPVLRALQDIEELRRLSDSALPQDDFPADPRAHLTELRAARRRLDEEHDALSVEVSAHERRLTLAPDETRILAAEAQIRSLVAENAVHHQDLVHNNDLDRSRDSQEALFRERAGHLFTTPPDAAGREALARLGLAELQSRIRDWEEAARGPELAREELRVAKEQIRTCELDFEAVPSQDAERKLRAREEVLRGIIARDDMLAALKRDIEASRAAAAAGKASAKDKRSSLRKRRALLLCAGGAATGASLLLGAAGAWYIVSPVAAGLLAAGVRLFRAREEVAGTPDEQRHENLRAECARLRASLDLHEFEAVAQHLEQTQQALAHVAARPELERRLIAARQRAEDCQRRVGQREAEATRRREQVVGTLSAFSLQEARKQQPGQDLFHDIEALRVGLREMTRLSGERQAVQERAQEREARAAALADSFDAVLPGPAMDAAPLWHEKLQLALAARRRAQEAERSLPGLQQRLTELLVQQRAAREAQALFEQKLTALAGQAGGAEEGLDLLEQARRRRGQADATQAELQRNHPDWQERGAEARAAVAAGEVLDLDTAQRIALDHEVSRLGAELEQLSAQIGALAAEREQLSAARSLSDVDGEIGACRRELAAALRRHDRLVLLAAVVREAERIWRETREIPLLAGACRYLARLTGGRWTRVLIEHGSETPQVFVAAGSGAAVRPVGAPLSRALVEQIWFALRLSLAEQLDGDEPLPLILDDVLSDWDEERQSAALACLLEVGTCRQVLLLTGQASVAERFRREGRAHVLELPAPPGPQSAQPLTAKASEAAKSQTSGKAVAPSGGAAKS